MPVPPQPAPSFWNPPAPQPQFFPQFLPQPLPQQAANLPMWIPSQQYITPYQFIPQQSSCQTGATYPFSQCGNQQSTDCSGCYFCNGVYNPQQCAFSPSCPLPCRIRG
ncbi:uncharacterized protein LOC108912675 [Anoplophora glabripennis]|uniref:uncharacterized protein LOC108912675 n=1 Tax=Anoplophora glabripennis TaxID=217634 RepID=UPI0008738771|nr:uncharacterized protein LOC108912675 [Anoplophora glabripennis]